MRHAVISTGMLAGANQSESAASRHQTLRALAAMFLLLLTSVCASQEMLRNPGFDARMLSDIAPAWKDNSAWADVDVEYNLVSESLSGTAQHIVCNSIASGAVQFVQPNIRLAKGQGYKIAVWAKGSLDGPLEIMLRKRGSPYTTYARKAFRISNRWKRYEFAATVGEDDPGAYFMVRMTGSGEIWLDKASLRPAPKPVSVASGHGNLVANGSFEIGLDRWAAQVRETGGYRHEMSIAYADVRPTIVEGEVPHGTRALHVDVPPHGNFVLTTNGFMANPGGVYTVSLWLKADKPRKVRLALKNLGHGANVVQGRKFNVTPQWKRYQFTTTVPVSGGNQYILLVQSRGVGGLWVDGAQVNSSDDEHYSPRRPVEVGFTRNAKSPLFYQSKVVNLELCVAAYEPLADDDAVLEVRSTDYHGKEELLLRKPIVLKQPERQCLKLVHPSDRTGYYKISARLDMASKPIDQASTAIGILPKPIGPPLASSPFGGHGRFSPASLKAMKMLGVAWLRMHPPLGTKWFIVEPVKGRYEFTEEPIRYAKAQGFHILGSLDSTPRWASSAPKDLRSEMADGFRAYPPTEISDWENYVTETVGHYKGLIDHWEVWNEPDSGGFFKLPGGADKARKANEYLRLVESAYKAAKAANSEAVVVAGAGTGKPPVRWLGRLVKRGVLDYSDALSFHYYSDGRPADALDIPASDRVDEVRALVASHNMPNVAYWETESGLTLDACVLGADDSSAEYCARSDEAVAFVVRNYISWLASGVERWFYYHMFFPDRTDRTTFAGFFHWDRSPKPLAIGYAIVSSMLTGADFVGMVEGAGAIVGAVFASDKRRITAYWVKEWSDESRHRFELVHDPRAQTTTIIDAMGVEVTHIEKDSKVSVEVGRAPIYRVDIY